MLRSAFDYNLPQELIAQAPLPQRRDSRLLCLDGLTARINDRLFEDFLQLLQPGDVVVLNDSRVLPARLFGSKATGGRVEIMAERVLARDRFLAQLRVSKPPPPSTVITTRGGTALEVLGRRGDFFELRLSNGGDIVELMEREGQLPLPPYITRSPGAEDVARYQTVFAREPGAVAAPTAGLHFDEQLLQAMASIGIDVGYVTLHVGAGTFQPVRTEHVEDHHMHAEVVRVTPALCDQVKAARARGGRVVAVGTTVVRSLESASSGGEIAPYDGETRLFISPGYRFASVDAMLTNFHLPESTLLMLVCAFGGYQSVMRAYEHAVQARYRFFSYGDAMFVTPHPAVLRRQ
jgi:S-adenosylmethionine:tRNA ribosyltransferase-isomerase